jgi:hypothetical protein
MGNTYMIPTKMQLQKMQLQRSKTLIYPGDVYISLPETEDKTIVGYLCLCSYTITGTDTKTKVIYKIEHYNNCHAFPESILKNQTIHEYLENCPKMKYKPTIYKLYNYPDTMLYLHSVLALMYDLETGEKLCELPTDIRYTQINKAIKEASEIYHIELI